MTFNNFKDLDLMLVLCTLQIFRDLEKACRKDCILSSNTSTIDIKLVGGQTKALDRIVGAHFFSPAHIMPLLEIVRTDQSSPQVIPVASSSVILMLLGCYNMNFQSVCMGSALDDWSFLIWTMFVSCPGWGSSALRPILS